VVQRDSKGRKIPVPKTPGLQVAIDVFDTAYRSEYSSKPTWSAAACASLKRLVTLHGHVEVIARIERLFQGALDWPHPPYTVGVLVAHFDRLVVAAREPAREPAKPRRGLSASEIASGKWRE